MCSESNGLLAFSLCVSRPLVHLSKQSYLEVPELFLNCKKMLIKKKKSQGHFFLVLEQGERGKKRHFILFSTFFPFFGD